MKYVKAELLNNVAVITIVRPESLNVLNLEVLEELEKVFAEGSFPEAGCVIITGAGEKAFIAGADIQEMQGFSRFQAKQFAVLGNRLLDRIAECPIPVIAVVNGYALGGGLEVALSCDIRIASEQAVFGFPETSVGIIPGFGGTQRLMRMINVGAAKEMIYSGTSIDAKRALQLGLVSHVFKKEELMGQAMVLAQRIAGNAKGAVKAAKKAVNKGANHEIVRGLVIETELFSECFEQKEQIMRMKAFLNSLQIKSQ